MNVLHLLIPIALAATALPTAAQNRIYVNHAATGANTGATWADAHTDLAAALTQAQAGYEVWVAQGIYRPTAGTARSVSFAPKSGVRLYGGFAGVETDLSQRDWAARPTVLSGDIGVPGDSTDNSYNVVYMHRPDLGTVLDGFVVRDGNATDTQAAFFARDRPICGGGLYIMAEDAEAYPDIANCRFERNTAHQSGGAVMVNAAGDGSALPIFTNCTLADNRSVRNGGGMARFGGSWVERGPFLQNCRFERNRAGQRGGGIYLTASHGADSLTLYGCVFEENSAVLAGGGTFFILGRAERGFLGVMQTEYINNTAGEGAAMELFPNGSGLWGDIIFDLCDFRDNRTNGNQNVNSISIFYVALLEDIGISKVKISNSTFRNNQSDGNIMICEFEADSIIFSNFDFSKNRGLIYGGFTALISNFQTTILSDVLFYKNQYNNTIFNSVYSSTLFLRNVLVWSNKTTQPSAEEKYLFYFPYSNPELVVLNSSFSNNNAAALFGKSSSMCTISNSAFQDTAQVTYFPFGWTSPVLLTHCYFDSLDCASLPPSVTCGPGMIIGGDPMFVAPDSGDYRLRPCSPLVNAGSNAYVTTPADLPGNPRIRGGTVDIGAYERQGPALAAAPSAQPSCPGGASGSIGIEVQEACPPLLVAWQSGAVSGTSLTGLPPGDYDLTVTDAKGLGIVFSVTVPVGDPPALAPHAAPVICGDTLGGSAAVSVSGATAPLAFDWGTLGTDSLLTGLPPGLYPVTLTDARGCTAVGSVQVERTGNLSVDITASAISCHGNADGSLTVLPANGKAPFAWNWNNPPGAAGPTVGPLGPGTYEGTLTDAFGCAIGWTLPLGQPGPLQPSAFVTDASDTGKADGSVLLIPTGGTAPYTALWGGGQTGLLLDSLPPGAYTATVTDANGCTAATPTILVGVTIGTGAPDAAADWQVLPNPASDVLSVLLDRAAASPLRVRVWGADGRLALEGVLLAGADRLVLDVGDLPRGMYFVQAGAGVRKVVLR